MQEVMNNMYIKVRFREKKNGRQKSSYHFSIKENTNGYSVL